MRFEKNDPAKWEIIDQELEDQYWPLHKYTGRALLLNNHELISAHRKHIKVHNIENSKIETYSVPASENASMGEVTWSLFLDKNDRLWIGTDQGVFYKNKDEDFLRKLYTQQDSHSPKVVFNMVEKDDNNLWLTCKSGLFLLNVNSQKIKERYWQNGKGKYQFPTDHILCFYKDQDGVRWVGTRIGLVRWDSQTGEKSIFGREDGFPDNTIYAILEDDYDNLWMSSDFGIIQFDKKTFQVHTYLPKHGTSYHEFNRISHFQEKDGTIYFGSLNGITSLHPKDFYEKSNDESPKLLVTNFHLFDGKENKLIDKTGAFNANKNIVLKPDDRFFRLEFALLGFSEKEQIQYAWKLISDNHAELEEWNFQKENILQFGRIPYGGHTLLIKAQDSDGQWSPHELAISVQPLKPFYFQTWFLLTVFFAFIMAIYFGYKNRTDKLQKQKLILQEEVAKATSRIEKQAEELREMDQLKSRLYTNITHEFRTPLTVISGMAGLIEKPQQPKELIKRNTRNLLRLVNQMLDLAKLESGHMNLQMMQADVVPFVQYLTESFQSYAESKSITLVAYMEVEELVMDFDEEKLHSVVSNILSNVIKFTPENGKIVLHLNKDERQLVLKIKDTGLGILPEKDGFEVCQTLKNDERTSHIPIVLLTAKADVQSKLEGLGVGADAYLSKPFLKEELLIRLSKLVELRRRLQEHFRGSRGLAGIDNFRVPKQELSLDERFLQKAHEHIMAHLGDAGFGNAQLASRMHLSESQLFRKLKALTGKSTAIFIRAIRLQQGREMLHNSELTVSEIAYEVGFSDPAYFSRTFSKEFGKSPNAMRK